MNRPPPRVPLADSTIAMCIYNLMCLHGPLTVKQALDHVLAGGWYTDPEQVVAVFRKLAARGWIEVGQDGAARVADKFCRLVRSRDRSDQRTSADPGWKGWVAYSNLGYRIPVEEACKETER